MLLSDQDISDMVGIASEHQVVPSSWSSRNIRYKRQFILLEGQRMGYRLRGQDQLLGAEDVLRAVELGCTSFLVYDEGLLWLLMR